MGWKCNVDSMNSKSARWSFNWEHISMFSSICRKKLSLCHHWTFLAYNCQAKQVRKMSLIFLKLSLEFLSTLKKLCLRIPPNNHFWNCKTLYRYNSCARYLRVPCWNVLYFTFSIFLLIFLQMPIFINY